jgi:hypothetical protein
MKGASPKANTGCSEERKSEEMYDLLFLILTAIFALLSILYVFGCERL